MKPHEMYSGAAPAAMGQMGQGLSEVGAGIARSIQSGYQGLGQGLAAGLTSAAQSIGGAMKEVQSAKTANSITKLMIDDPQYSHLLGLDPNSENYETDRKNLKDELKKTIKDYGEIGGAMFSRQFLNPIQEYYATGRAYKQQEKIAGIAAETARQAPWNTMFAGQFGQALQDPMLPQRTKGFGGGSTNLGTTGQPMVVPKSYLGNF